ncbi:DUF2345 domain-containing protein, partial [Psychrobacter sp. AOP42-A1-21]|uniref:DUF2345 domain-containing protein n=1 Tax=Psychrobacter sp. AOP42-A1-21 TaxID=3457675 RepID=UPI0040367BA1
VADGQFSMTNGKDNIMLSAHTGKLEATAKQDVNMSSSTKEVEVVATNKITLTAGGASITLDGGDITIAAMQFTEKAGKHSRDGGGMDGQGLPLLPETKNTSKQMQFTDDDDVPYANTPYTATYANGRVIDGMTNEKGFTAIFYSTKSQDVQIQLHI